MIKNGDKMKLHNFEYFFYKIKSDSTRVTDLYIGI